jgi:hypothetical protein
MLSKPSSQWCGLHEIPACAGMTKEGAGMTQLFVIPAQAGI